MTARAKFTEADVARLLKGARTALAAVREVIISDGAIRLILDGEQRPAVARDPMSVATRAHRTMLEG